MEDLTDQLEWFKAHLQEGQIGSCLSAWILN